MFRASTRILAGIVVISSTAGIVPEVAYADDVCNAGSIAAGEMQSFPYSLTSSVRAQFTLDSEAQDVVMQITDDSNNVACQTSLPNPGHQTCGWMPAEGASYVVKVLRPLTASAAADIAAPAGDDNATNNGQGAAADQASAIDTGAGDTGATGDSGATASTDAAQSMGGNGGWHRHRFHRHGQQQNSSGAQANASGTGDTSGAGDNATTSSDASTSADANTSADAGAAGTADSADNTDAAATSDDTAQAAIPAGPPASFNLCSVHVE